LEGPSAKEVIIIGGPLLTVIGQLGVLVTVLIGVSEPAQ